METIDHSDEYRRLQELYADMSDSRLEQMADGIDDLTEIAQQVLRAEMAKRGLGAPLQGAAAVEIARQALQRELSEPDEDAPFAAAAKEEDPILARESPADPNNRGSGIPNLDPHAYDPIAIWYVDDPAKAQHIMGILNSAGIKSYLGPDNVENVEDYKGSYEDGVEVKVMKFQARFAVDGLRRVLPPEPERESADDTGYAIGCPKCNSEDLIFQGIVVEAGKGSAPVEKNSWTCDACGHQWKDDGIEGKV
jgi:hypothetical protein